MVSGRIFRSAVFRVSCWSRGREYLMRTVALAARVGCLICWIGEAGVRLYSAGQPGGARADRLLYQASLALNEDARLKVVKQMYRVRFGDEPPAKRSVNQLRGIEGARSASDVQTFREKIRRSVEIPRI